MKKIITLDIFFLITLAVVFGAVYSLLLQDNCFNTSISSIISRTHNLELKEHLVVLGLLPIYIATVIFGSALLGMYISTYLRHIFTRQTKKHRKNSGSVHETSSAGTFEQ